MASAQIDLGDFTCSICREIFDTPVSLSCLHCYCQACLSGVKKPSTEILSIPPASPITPTIIYKPKVHESDQCFVCAICRKESLGYADCRDIEEDLKTLEALCPHCSKSLMLCEIRIHLETCTPPKKVINADEIRKVFTGDFLRQLSRPQATALQKAREGENRSTFPCPYCPRANFPVEHLCKHIEKHHAIEDPRRVCPICAAMPWGDKNKLSSNVYEHLLSRHRFDYETYVNYEQDEESMISEAVERSMLFK